MKRLFLSMAALVCVASMNAQSKAALYDSTKVEQLQEVVVKGVRAQKNAPYAVTNIKKQQLNQFSTTGKELPILFSQTPGVLAWSENGVGTGTTYMRIRGAGDSRINVTLDGVPLNSPEDQCVFWANMNSYGSWLGADSARCGNINQWRWRLWWYDSPFIGYAPADTRFGSIRFIWIVQHIQRRWQVLNGIIVEALDLRWCLS